jgi:hypothetical protein
MDESKLTKAKYAKPPFSGPYRVLQVRDNGTVVLDMGKVIDTVNIRNIKPFRE